VVDIRLPGDRDGIDTALELFREHGIRCIFASAYSDREARQRAEDAAPLGWLQKPYTMTSLTELVQAAVRQLRGKTRQ
jgi:DNA-binding NarL/FixJ family response regulator